MRTAIVHDWLSTFTGAERVLEQLSHCLPTADLYAICDFLPPGEREFLVDRHVRTSFIQRLPFARRLFRHYLPLMPLAIEQFDLTPFDIIVSSSWAVAKGVITGPDQLHISYTHTPIRYAWELQHQYLKPPATSLGAVRDCVIRVALHKLRLWDFAATRRADVLVANSRNVARRIKKCYGRRARVIYPPVSLADFPLHLAKDDYYVTASRLVPYKRVDLVVEAFKSLKHRTLVVVGDGPEMKRIKSLAGPNVEILGHQSRQRLRDILQRARAFIFAAEEDFGIAPVESQACGTPVIAYGRGGCLETVIDGETGTFFGEQTPAAIAAAIEKFERRSESFDALKIRANAERFSAERFRREFTELLDGAWDRFASRGAGWNDDVAAAHSSSNGLGAAQRLGPMALAGSRPHYEAPAVRLP